MATAPNYAYVRGTTPATGGQAALFQAIKSMLLGVSTTVAAAVTSTGSQAVTPAAMTNIGIGTSVWINWGLSDQECVSVTATTGGTFTANFTLTHAANFTVTCGLPTLGVSSPWSTVNWTGTNMVQAYQSQNVTENADANSSIILAGHSSTANTFGFSSCDDIDNAGTNAVPKNPINYINGSGVTNVMPIQDASFNFWITVCEFGIAVETLVSATYAQVSCMSLRPFLTSEKMSGVGIATAPIASAAGSVTVTPDISSRLKVGQVVMIQNQSRSSASTNFASANCLMTISSLVSGGSNCTINFTGTTPRAYDTGALVGAVVPNVVCYGGTSVDNTTVALSHNNDGTYISSTGNTATLDLAVVTTNLNSNNSPTNDANVMYGGQIDLPIDGTVVSLKGRAGFLYCWQEFVPTGVNNQDVFWDPGPAACWKAFKGTNACGMGPLLNPANTSTNMVPGSIPWVP